jgi:hypothetical protein
MKLTNYQPTFEAPSGVQNEDADAYLDRLVSTPCGSDGLTFSSKSNNSSAKSLAHAGKMVPSSLVKTKNESLKRKAFAERYPQDAELIGYDDEVDARFKEFTEYDRTNEVAETVQFMNQGRAIPMDVSDRVAKHVASIGGYSGYLTSEIKQKFTTFAFNYWLSKNPELQDTIIAGLDNPIE